MLAFQPDLLVQPPHGRVVEQQRLNHNLKCIGERIQPFVKSAAAVETLVSFCGLFERALSAILNAFAMT